ncbi:MAG TPA: hypothetical protein VMG12_27915 [Polyangiaceae bacterium]|nr:hypothetical protein [Polyangiaceae bacterium]
MTSEETALEPSSGQGAPAAPGAGPLYAIATQVFGADTASSTRFVRLVSSLDAGEIGLDAAREYNGRASVGSVGDWLFVMDGEQPIGARAPALPSSSSISSPVATTTCTSAVARSS